MRDVEGFAEIAEVVLCARTLRAKAGIPLAHELKEG
jgi:hypothetical protein